MRLKSVAKLGVTVSLTLFCIAVALYCFGGFDIPKNDEKFNLYSLVPSDAVCVVESDNINFYYNEFSHLSYSERLDSIESFSLARLMLGALNDYSSKMGHGLNGNMGHILISIHDTLSTDNQVLYFYTDKNDANVLDKMLQGYLSSEESPQKEKYMGKKMYEYTLNNDKKLSIYKGKDYRAVSFNKGLIRKVIESQNDGTSLGENQKFVKTHDVNQSHNYLTLYCKNPILEQLNDSCEAWSQFDFHISSDVIYLTGETRLYGDKKLFSDIDSRLKNVHEIDDDSIVITSDIDSMRDNMEEIYTKRSSGLNTIFDECVANVSQDASFMMVVDMDKLCQNSAMYQSFILPFIWNHKSDFSDFILSTQLSLVQNSLMHVIVLTYKG